MNPLQLGYFGIDQQHYNECQANLTNNTHNHQKNIMPEGAPENLVAKQLRIICKAVKSFNRTALPFKKAVKKSRKKRCKHCEHIKRYRHGQICSYYPSFWFNRFQHYIAPISFLVPLQRCTPKAKRRPSLPLRHNPKYFR